MKLSSTFYSSLILGLALLVSACSETQAPESSDGVTAGEDNISMPSDETTKAVDGRIVISSKPKGFEPNACILFITIRNGTQAEATVSMMQFTVTGTGEPDSGNMFGQSVAAGETNTAQLLFPTRQCDELLEISAPNLSCMTEGEDCSGAVEFESAPDLTIKRAVN